ncbi:MAG: aldehyde dehydrogenase family protein, partial [Phycisphaerales bacterium]|nr:aldehyde dehydrogenase family protein [Phycisphaerales bacterium]
MTWTARREASALIGGAWRPTPGQDLVSRNPASPDDVLFSGATSVAHVGEAVDAARDAFEAWSATPFEARAAVLRTYRDLCASRVDEIADLICAETGKVLWDSRGEASILGPKVDITLDDAPNSGMGRVRPFDVTLSETRSGRCWFRPHGVMAVVGPFNFPAHLPNGHIVPALAMGNTIVLKPSDKTPAVGQCLGSILHEALEAHGAPP